LYDNAGLDSPKKSELWTLIAKGENPLIVETPEDFDKLFAFIFAEPPFVPPPVKSYLARMAVAHHDGFSAAWKDIFAKPLPLEPILGALHTPTLVVWGDQDRLIDVSTTEVLKTLVPSAKVVILPHCGHVPMVERPEESARLMAELVESH
jgi:pimeloyl-ACP methyl ester carboxylesterase